MSKFRLACLASSALVLASAPYAVMAQETTAAIHGEVVSGAAPAANTAVTIVHTPSGTRQNTATNAAGVFDARGLRVGGPYTISVGGKSYDGVYLELGKTFVFNADLAEAEVQAVEVVATAANRDKEQGPKTVISRRAIEAVVSVNRDIRDIARGDILVASDLSGARSGTNSGGISIAGSNPRFNRITVDGVSANDSFGLAQGGLTTARGPVTIDAVEQFVVAAVPTDVENGDFTGGAMNLVLRSGGNSFHGTAFVNYLNDGLVGTHLGDLKIRQPISQKNYGGFLSGPIFKDKLFFAVSYENYKTSDSTLTGYTGQGLANSVPNMSLANFNQITNIYNNNYASDFNIGSVESTQPVTDKKYSAKLDWNISDRHRASLTYRFAKSTSISRTDASSTGSTPTLTPTSHWYEQLNQDEATTFELHSNWTDNLATTFKATYREYKNGQNPPSGQNYADIAVCDAASSDSNTTSCAATAAQLRWGPDQFRHANSLSELETRLNFQAEYTLGSNLFKIGTQARRASPYDLFVSQSHGVYYFDSVADFQAGNASRLQYQNSVTGNAGDAAFETTYWTYSLFAQDSVDLTDNFKVTGGARFDWYSYPDKPLLNPNFLARNGYTNQGTLDGKSIIQPRFAAEWRLRSNLKISGGVGLFAGGAPDVLTGTPFYNTGYATTSVDIQRGANGLFTDANNTPGFTQAIGAAALSGLNTDPKFGYVIPASVQALQQGTLTGTPAIPPLGEVFALDPKFKIPGQWKAYLSGQWNFKEWDFGVDLVASQAKNEITYYDSRAQPLTIGGVQQFLPDGRVRYDGLSTAASVVIPGRNSTSLGANRDLIITNVDKGHSFTAGFSLSRSWRWGGDFAIGYARSSADDMGPGLRFGTTAGSLYGSVPAWTDPNRSYIGRSVDEIKNRYKLQIGYRHDFIKDNETRISLFGERQSGRPFGFTMSDAASGRSPVFGVNQTAQALYVPDLSGNGGADGLSYGLVHFATAGDRDRFVGYVQQFGLKQGLVKKYSNTNDSVNRLDLQISQQLPSVLPGHHFKVVADIRNVLNLLNRDWGAAKEYNDVNTVTRVSCLGPNYTPLPSTGAGAAACNTYSYSSVASTISKTNNNALSLWYAQISLKYEF